MASAETRRRMQATKGKDNPLELRLRSVLHCLGFRFRVHRRVLKGSTRTADLAFVRQRVAVFVDGCFWHGCPLHMKWPKTNSEWWQSKIEANRRRDVDTDTRLKAEGWSVIRIWEHEPVESAVERIVETIKAMHTAR